MNNITWILVADSSKACIYSAFKTKLFKESANEDDITLVQEYENPISHQRTKDLVSDSSGRYRAGRSGTFASSDTYDPPTDPKRYEESRFALQICREFQAAYTDKKFNELIIIAPPVFMGMLNQHLLQGDPLKKLIIKRIEKDYTDLKKRELVKQLQQFL